MPPEGIKRNRTIKSCRYCYEHKLKCDRAVPCSTCSTRNFKTKCIYKFDKEASSIAHGANSAKQRKVKKHEKFQKMDSTPKDGLVYKPRSFYPFFENLINEKILCSSSFGSLSLSLKFSRNEITKFRKNVKLCKSIDDALALLPPSSETALSQVETYFDAVHPIIPILNKKKMLQIVKHFETFRSISTSINLLDLLLLMALLFCASYAAVASGVIPDLLLCNKYYGAYQFLLNACEFPTNAQIASLQAFTIVNFVIDPNMVSATAYSTMLVRLGQQLGLHKMNDIEYKLLWHFLLYYEGSASVVSGLPYFTPRYLMFVSLLPKATSKDQNGAPLAYTVGRCKINAIFRNVMEISAKESTSEVNFEINAEMKNLYDEILQIGSILQREAPLYNGYFESTLMVFLYRLHLRHAALSFTQSRKDELLRKTSGRIVLPQPMDVKSLLTAPHKYGEEVIHLSLLLLFRTYERLVQEKIAKFSWYTLGSTVMQYLFVVIKDLYQTELKSYQLNDFSATLRRTMTKDIVEILATDAVFFRFVLVDGLIGLLEAKIAGLWSDEDLYKFILVRTIKEKVWQVFEKQLKENEERVECLRECKLFACGKKHLQNLKSINYEDYVDSWQCETILPGMESFLMDWLVDLQG
ncbi:uncharacterized protein ZBAI_01119 [Zygosaccharomyces bailii ISA1307]|uniref:BN860_08240g1_1 n=1 Tax=Zygosaccharomyces bailii (strain CLIB 213 / ATCC 58445 / CBS 680 / BCRC 21525 / NBRC 1098 / NCYC 1416 / NRRL Y-2227) TaxID=1333698 RepID=A0A8J2WUP1_ZYGB2|nr:BN860_08240g1_1 [Zygosaccharomyces bailii CLIB 213]CDH09335.1 uncharacterized protein ZBAI_01119 [Zygosaccharomyces bailii ISA1307]